MKRAVVVAVSCCMSLGFVCAQESTRELLQGINSEQPLVRERVVQEVLAKRKQMINILMEMFPSEKVQGVGDVADSFRLAVVLLGELRASEAVSKLIEHLDYEVDVRWRKVPAGAQYPCAFALTQIGGLEVVERVVESLAKDTSEKRRKLSAWIVYTVLGKSLGTVFLESRIDGQAPVESDRIRQALTDIEQGNALVNPG